MQTDSGTPFSILLTIVVLGVLCLLGAAMIILMSPLTGLQVKLGELFYATATVPESLTYSVASVISMDYAHPISVANSTAIPSGTGCHHLTVSNSTGLAGQLNITHTADPSGVNIVYFNGVNIGVTSNAANTILSVPGALIANGDNTVCYGGGSP
jgi:hypothetical protein